MEDGSGELHSINSRVENNDYQQMYNLGEEHYPNYNTAGYEQSDGMEEDIYEDDLYNQAEEGTSEMLYPDNNNEYQMAEEDENKQTRVYYFTPKENVPSRYFFLLSLKYCKKWEINSLFPLQSKILSQVSPYLTPPPHFLLSCSFSFNYIICYAKKNYKIIS